MTWDKCQGTIDFGCYGSGALVGYRKAHVAMFQRICQNIQVEKFNYEKIGDFL